MKYTINRNTDLLVEETAFPGVKRIAGYVSEDMNKIFGQKNAIVPTMESMGEGTVFVATVGMSDWLDKAVKEDEALSAKVNAITGKREVYAVTEYAGHLAIIGSDKRGTIYGLFYFSESLGVSPFVNWGDVVPVKKEEVVLGEEISTVSKEPSVEYRGFFINDEWPAFGNWSVKHFGDANAKCYEKIFELLLRLKGNYLWPAMWSEQFNLDGPGIENARLADEMGVVMGMSHHEPCNRSGEEYKYVRGPESPYGDDWNFVRNRQGITKFWEDGLLRDAPFETVITVGMRGEADSTILGHEATLADNIEYLRDVLVTQEDLIRRCVNEDVMKVPRMLALYKEVEPFFYGDGNTPGLMDSPQLEGVTLMLCDDNFGNLRTIPTEHMKGHNGGYGMYYHFDYHGSPISYEWINSSYIPRVWESMCTAYDNDIRKLWIVNVGDIFTTEFPLGFFLDLAYDYDKWGRNNKNAAREYTEKFIRQTFPSFSPMEKEVTYELLEGYTRLAHNRRPETLSASRILENMRKDDLDGLYRECLKLSQNAEMMYRGMTGINKFPFYEFVYYPLMGNMNNHIMILENAYNKFLAGINAVKANEMNDTVLKCIDFDKKLVKELDEEHEGFWYGMGRSEHIGFNHWNEEECSFPVLSQVIPTNKKRIVAVIPGTGEHTEGGDWTKRPLFVYTDREAVIELFATSYQETPFRVDVKGEGIVVSETEGTISPTQGVEPLFITVSVDAVRKAMNSEDHVIGKVTVHTECGGHIDVLLMPALFNPVQVVDFPGATGLKAGTDGELGLAYSGTVSLEIPMDGDYSVHVFTNPTNPPFMDNKLEFVYSVNGSTPETINTVSPSFKVGDNQEEWYKGVINNTRITTFTAHLNKGKNEIKLDAASIGLVFQRVCVERLK